MKKLSFLIVFFNFSIGFAEAQSTKKLLHTGQELFEQKKYDQAVKKYSKAIETGKMKDIGSYNYGASLYRLDKADQAAQQFLNAAQAAKDPKLKANSLHNLGNSLLKQKQYQEALKAFQYSLMLEPTNENTRYNLAYTMQMLKKEEQQKKNDPKQEKKPEQQEQKQEQQEQEQKDQQQKQQQQLNKSNAENMLNALNQSEKQIQKKVKDNKGKAQKRNTEKDW